MTIAGSGGGGERVFPRADIKREHPAHRQLAISIFIAAKVSVLESAATPGS